MSGCIVCGKETSGVRCREHNARFQKIEAARALADSDRQLLQWKGDGLSGARIAARLGITSVRVYQKLHDARRRQALLKQEDVS